MDSCLGVLLLPFRLAAAILMLPFTILGGLFGGGGRRQDAPAQREQRGAPWVAVVGESFYQDNLEKICGKRKAEGERRKVRARVIPDPKNPHDKNAVRVEINGLLVGHLSRELAAQMQKRLPKSGMEVPAEIRGGWDRGKNNRGHYGVWVAL